MDRWTDPRLDDRFAAIDRTLKEHDERIRTQAETSARIGAMDAQIASVLEDTRECRDGIDAVKTSLAATTAALEAGRLAQAEAKLVERAELERERKSDRRWLIGTVLTVTALLIAAMGVLQATGAFG
jgi:chromosome segregation ATPase